MVRASTKWKRVLDQIKSTSTEMTFKTWFKALSMSSVYEETGIAVVIAGNPLIQKIVSGRYYHTLSQNFEDVFGQKYDIYVKLEEEANEPIAKKRAFREYDAEYLFHPKWTFDTFVVGEHNSLAHAAAVAVAEAPSEVFNPLFIYGGSGLGKTHLMHAIGRYIMENSPDKKVLYVSSEMFTNEFIDSIRDTNKKKKNSFQEKYRKQDVLLIDDVQFIEDKPQTEKELFNTYNELINFGKQIVLSSDRPPSKLENLDERLSSRFEQGAVAIYPPDFETRVAILQKKAELEDVEITEEVSDVINLLSEKIKYNVRILESAFLRVVRFSRIRKEPITVKLMNIVLKDTLSSDRLTINPEYIKKKVSKKFNIKVSDMESSKRTRDIAYPRQICMYLCRELTELSYPQIGKHFGNRDHSTVLHAYEKISDEVKNNNNTKVMINDLINSIKDE